MNDLDQVTLDSRKRLSNVEDFWKRAENKGKKLKNSHKEGVGKKKCDVVEMEENYFNFYEKEFLSLQQQSLNFAIFGF